MSALPDPANDPPSPEQERIAALERENWKLKRINKALMDRVERSMDYHGNAFSLFQTAIVLESRVRERTQQLQETLRELEASNSELARAKEAAETAQTRLAEAIESVNEGFALFDAEDRLVLCNKTYLSLWPAIADLIRPGISFGEIAKLAAARGSVLPDSAGPDRWVRERVAQHAGADGTHVHALSDGRWIQINERRTRDGGIVGIYTDITDVKERDARDGQERIRLITDAMPALIAYVDADETYRFVNRRYGEMFRRPRHEIVGSTMRELLGAEAYAIRQPHIGTVMAGQETQFDLDYEGRSGKRYSQATYVPHFAPDGTVLGFFSLIQDVTERRRAADALREANEGLERRVAERTVALKQEIAERQQIEEKLREAKTAAEQANLSKTKFLAAASHDLLQPLNAARLFVSALTETENAPGARVLVEKTDAALLSVEDLLEALLDISKLDAGVVQPQPDDFPLALLLSSMQAEYAPVAKERGLDLRVLPCRAIVHTDMRLLRRILQNFVSNALRYTRTGRVLVGCRRVGDGVRIEVLDTGPGIPPDKLEAVFEEFRRLEGDRPNGRDRGMGLGLAIVQRAGRMLNHPIGLRSALGKGSAFTVTVPLGSRTVPGPPAQPRVTQPASPLTGARILVIDNEQAILDGMGALLRGWGCQVQVAPSADGAMGVLPALGGWPDVIIADYHLEDGALGIDAIARIIDARGHDIPAMVITANRTADVHERVQGCGYALLTKPVKPAQLRALVTQLIG